MTTTPTSTTTSTLTSRALVDAGLDPVEVFAAIRRALDEDLRYGPDVTTLATVGADAAATADVAARRPGAVAGVPVAVAVLDAVGIDADAVNVVAPDGTLVGPGDIVLSVTAPLQQLLTAERTLLNFMTHLSGIATATHAWVVALAGTGCVVRDTRKTTPGLRLLEKYAVRCGGGANHRLGLGDAALIKDNHVVAAGGIRAAIDAVRAMAPELPLEVECDTVDQVRTALAAGCDLILLDNMDLAGLREAVGLARPYPGVRLEASGGLTLDNAAQVASTGVDFVSVGGLTHSSPALDLGLDLRPLTSPT